MRSRTQLLTTADVEDRPWLLEEADGLTQLLYVQHGVLDRGQAMRHLSSRAVEHRLSTQEWRAVHRGIYVVGPGPLRPEQRRWVAILAAGDGAVLAGRTALEQHGLRNFGSDLVHVLVPARRRVFTPPRGVRVHRTSQLEEADLAAVRPPCAVADRALVDAAGWARTDREARTVIAIAFQQRLVTEAGVHAVLARLTRVKRRGYTARHVRLAAGGAHSLAELDMIALLRKAGLPEPTLQKERCDADGRRRYLDLYYETWGLHIEIDGAGHLDVRQAWLDADRQNKLWIKGDRLLRFPAWLVLDHPADVIAQVRDALVAAGWDPDLGSLTTL